MNLHRPLAGYRLALFLLATGLALALPSVLTAGSLKDINFNGVSQATACGTCRPPDTHGAVGHTQYVQTVNQRVRVYSKAPQPGTSAPTLLRDDPLDSFFQYFDTMIFDPRVVYDSDAQRWIISAEAMPNSPTEQWHFIAVSDTNDATGSFTFYQINVNFLLNDNFWDFPQLGLSANAIILTANIFDSSAPNATFLYSDVVSISKSDLYNGVLSYRLFTGLPVFSLAPPIVVDSNPDVYLISAAPSGSALTLYNLQNAGTLNDELAGPFNVAVSLYIPPSPATQPGTGATLDAGDSRFANASVQKGIGLWQIHTIGNGGYVTPKFYLLDLVQKNVAWTHLYFASQTSNDFNASVAGGPVGNGNIFASWTSNDPAGNIQTQARFSGTDTLGPPVFNGASAYTSPTFYGSAGTQRWGDYSAITVDPANTNQAWATNETVETQTNWGTRIFNIGIP